MDLQKNALKQFQKQKQDEDEDKYSKIQLHFKNITLKKIHKRLGVIEISDENNLPKDVTKEFFIKLKFTNEGINPISQTEIKYIFFTINDFESINSPKRIIPFNAVTQKHIKHFNSTFSPGLNSILNNQVLSISEGLINGGITQAILTKGNGNNVLIRTGLKENETISLLNNNRAYLGVQIKFIDDRTKMEHTTTECYLLPRNFKLSPYLTTVDVKIKELLDKFVFNGDIVF